MSKVLEELAKMQEDWIRIAKAFVPDDQAEGIVQDMYLKIHDGGKAFDEIKFGNQINKKYIYDTIKSICFDYYRNRKDFISLDSIVVKMEEDDTIDDSSMEKLKNLILELPELQAQTIELRYERNLLFREIAEETGENIMTHLSRHRYALKKINKIINKNNIKLR